MNRPSRALNQLIAMKKETVDALKRDLDRLGKLVDQVQLDFSSLSLEETAFLDDCRNFERDGELFSSDEAMFRRRFLDHLSQGRIVAQGEVQQVLVQQRLAQQALEAAFAEVQVLKRVVDRRQRRIQAEGQRLQYRVSDDLELLRSGRQEGAHV